MALKQRVTYTFIMISFFLILFTGCRKEEIDFNYSNARVEVILSPGGVGDQGYNDKILRGFQEAAVKYGFTLAVHIPEEKEQGIQIYEDWLNASLDDDCERSLFVFSGSEYEYLLEEGLTLPDDNRKDVLMFETERETDGIYTFYVGCYAASYLAGATSVLDINGEEQKALVIAANPHDRQVKRAVDGYRDGYLAAGGDGCDVHYLSEDPDGGYRMQDEAYQLCMSNDGKYMYYFSAAGASNKGLYRFSRETLKLAAENIRKADIGVKVVYEWVDEDSANLTEVGQSLSKREDIQNIIGCNVSANTQKLAFALARKKENIKPLFTFSTSQELPRIFGHRGFLWGLCETDISQSEIMLSCLSNENPGIKKVALLASDDIYGQTFVDWFAFQAVELNLEPVCIETYKGSSELESCLQRVVGSGAEALVCVPSAIEDVIPVHDYIQDFMYNSPDGQYIALMFADKAYNKSILDDKHPVDFISGLAPASHPNSGFGVSYDAIYGRVPYAGEAEVYDAVLITTLATIWASQNDEKDLNKAISALLNGTAVSQGGWTAGMISKYHRQIMAGETPAISGATGTLDFDSEYYTTIRSTSYARWITYNGEMVIIDYYSRNSGGHSSSPVAAWEWKKQHMQDVDGNGNEISYPELQGHYAVLVAASESWKNYRHQADVLGFYHYLKEKGYDDDHIILIMADDIAFNEKNPLQGVVRREVSGRNLYDDLQIDYKLGDLTLNDLKQILTSEPSETYPVTLGSSLNDNVIFFWSGHGTQNGWKWRETEDLNSDFARSMFSEMQFRKMFAIVETCYSGGVAQGCTGIPGLLMMTAANPYETSKADAFDNELQVYLSNTFTSSILSQLGNNSLSTIYNLYLHAFDKTQGSHVMVYNAAHYGNLYFNDLGEFYPYSDVTP